MGTSTQLIFPRIFCKDLLKKDFKLHFMKEKRWSKLLLLCTLIECETINTCTNIVGKKLLQSTDIVEL